MRTIRTLFSNIACLTIGIVAAVSCTTSTDPVPIASITLLPGIDSIELGQTYGSWVVILRDAHGETITGRSLSWESKNTAVATIDPSTGVVTAVGTGETVIIVRAGGKEATAAFRVLRPVLSVVVTPDSFDLPLTTTRQISVQLIGPDGVALTNRLIVWSSDDPSVAVVSTSGVVTPVKLGTTTIKIRVGETIRATVRVRVVGEPVTGVRIIPQQSVFVLRQGQSRQLTAECLSATGQVIAGRPLVWVSSNPVVVSVNNFGLVTGLALGTANIGVACDGTASTSVTVQVTLIPVASVVITPSTLALQPGRSGQLLVTAYDSTGASLSTLNRQVTWVSNNIPVASVNPQGVVFASGIGTADIRVTVDGVESPPATVTVASFLAMSTRKPAWLASSRPAGELPDR